MTQAVNLPISIVQRVEQLELEVARLKRRHAGPVGYSFDAAGRPLFTAGIVVASSPAGGSRHINAADNDVLFSWPPTTALALALSGRFYSRLDMMITGASASLHTAGTGTTTVDVKVNGNPILTLTFAAGDFYASTELAYAVTLAARVDYLQVETTAVGASAAGLTVQTEVG